MNTAPKDSASPTAPRASRAADSSKVPYDAQLGSPFRGYFLWPLTFLWAVSFAMLIPVAALVAPQWFKKHGWCLPRTWGRVPLWWHGVKVDVTGEENLEFEGPRLLLFNHVSLLDLLIMAAHCPENSIVIHKKELLKIPGLGIGLKSLGMIAIDRKDTKSAIASMNSAAERIRENGESVIMAPEGTRSRKGGLQRFKKGPFHLAIQTGAPLVPFLMRGVDQVLPMGSILIRPGRIAIDILPPISSVGWERKDMAEHMYNVREVFLEYLSPEA
jgi:1-acyl-sn-glycerol-3-phosphate acyltransferase